MVPHLVTALSGPLLDLERRILDATPSIERWFRMEWQEHTPPFYCSVDLRNSGAKIAPIETNLFPSAFNNLSADVLPLAVQAAMAAVDKICPDARNLLLIPGDHARSGSYLQSVARLAAVLRQTGLNVRIGSINPGLTLPAQMVLPDGQMLTVEPLLRSGRRIGLKNFDPCAVLINSDLSAGIPEQLVGLHEQTLLPPLHAGGSMRRRSQHFAAYDDVAKKFSKMLDIDPWLINTYFAVCAEISFEDGTGEESLAGHVDFVLAKIRKKYREYGIKETPFLVVKLDAATYGGAVMTVKDASEVRNLTDAARSKMSMATEGSQGSGVILQEGVHTFETVKEGVAEPVVYMMDRYVVGGFYRVHGERGKDENLNAPGMEFVPLPFASSCILPDPGQRSSAAPNRFYAYGVLARLGLLAASLELERTDPDPEIY